MWVYYSFLPVTGYANVSHFSEFSYFTNANLFRHLQAQRRPQRYEQKCYNPQGGPAHDQNRLINPLRDMVSYVSVAWMAWKESKRVEDEQRRIKLYAALICYVEPICSHSTRESASLFLSRGFRRYFYSELCSFEWFRYIHCLRLASSRAQLANPRRSTALQCC